jgi:iron(III) transport system substrate-binding protein
VLRALLLILAMTLVSACSQGPPKKRVVVYTPFPQLTAIALAEAFEAKYPHIEVEQVMEGTTKVYGRIKAERENPRADVWYGAAGMIPFIDATREGLLEPYIPQGYEGMGERRGNLLLRDKDWHWMGMSVIGLGFAFNPQVVPPEQAPKTWNDFIDPRWKGKIEMWDPSSSGTAMLFLNAALLRAIQEDKGEEAGWDYLKAFWVNLKGYTKEGKPAFSVARGEVELGIHFEHQVLEFLEEQTAGLDLGEQRENIRWVLPPDSPITVDPIALVKGCKNPEEAKLFIDFVVGKEGQAIVNRLFFTIDPSFPPPKGLKGLTYDEFISRAMRLEPDWMAEHLEPIKKRWQNEVEEIDK